MEFQYLPGLYIYIDDVDDNDGEEYIEQLKDQLGFHFDITVIYKDFYKLPKKLSLSKPILVVYLTSQLWRLLKNSVR